MSSGRIGPAARMLADAARVPVLIATAAPEAVRAKTAGMPGVEVIGIPRDGAHLDLAALMGALAARGITRVMVEAGPTLAEAFATAGLCDELVLLTGPQKLVTGLKAIGAGLADWQAKAEIGEDRMLGPDRLRSFSKGA